VRFANAKFEHEKANLVITNPGLRADFYLPEFNMIVDLRTAATSDKTLCRKAATSPGAAAEAGIQQKNDKWKTHVEAQGDVFLAIVHEDGGRLSETAKTLLNRLARHFSCIPSEQSFYVSYALQRLHSVAQKGVARLCRAVQPMPLGAMHLPTQTMMNALGAPMRRPEGVSLALLNLPPENRPIWSVAASQRFQTRPAAQPDIRVPLLTAVAAVPMPPAMALPFALPPVLPLENVTA
jgi:hypothetical protein